MSPPGPYHLSSPNLTIGVHQPTHSVVYNPAEQAVPETREQNLFGLSTRKVYTATDVTINAVGSYPTISPLLQYYTRYNTGAVYFLLHSLLPISCSHQHLPVRKCVALCCPDFPPVK